jgi:hypothetical protein
MTRSLTIRLLAALCLASAIVGCCPKPRVAAINANNDPPNVSMSEVVGQINANSIPITSLRADHRFWAYVHDDKHRERKFDGDGALLYRKMPQKPDELLMTGNVITGKVFELGSTSGPDAEYWVAFMPPSEEGTEWWGHYKNLGKPCSQGVPIQPNLVAEVLGVTDIATEFLRQPVPTMRFINDGDAYAFDWMIQLPDRWAVQKEVWFDRATKLPTKVLLFDENGRTLLRANLFNHQPVEGTDGKKIATLYDLFFPMTKDTLRIKLQDPRLTYKGVPNAKTIRRRPLPDVREVQIDKDCE